MVATADITGNATGGVVTIDDDQSGRDIYGYYYSDTTDANGARVTIKDGAKTRTIDGGYSGGGGDANNNWVIVTGGTVHGYIDGGYASSYDGSANNNRVIISGGTVNGSVWGGDGNLNANSNTVTISGGLVDEDIYGGEADSGNANNNTVTISGGTVAKDVYGGVSYGGDVTNNTITIKKGSNGNPSFGIETILYGGYDWGASNVNNVKTGNTLNLHTTGLKAKNLENFANLHFYIPASTTHNTVFLELTDAANTDLTQTKVGVVLDGGSPVLRQGDKVVLLKKSDNSNGIIETENDADTLTNTTTAMHGIAGLYDDFTITRTNDKKQLVATLGSNPQTSGGTETSSGSGSGSNSSSGNSSSSSVVRVNPQVKSLSEARSAAVAFINRGADLASGSGMQNLVQATQVGGIQGFAAMGGGKTRTETGSHIDVKGVNLLFGAGTSLANAAGKLTLGAFFEAGRGSYNSFNDFANRPDVRASGKTHYYGVGLMAQQAFNNGFLVEGGVRVGRSELDYHSNDLIAPNGAAVRFDSKSTYTGLNLGAGYKVAINDTSSITPYAKVLWTHYKQNKRIVIGTSPFNLHNIDSVRTQLGARFQYQINPQSHVYADAAWEREHKGTASGEAIDIGAMPQPTLKGNSGLVGAGIQFKPNDTLSLDFGVNGSFGKRRGVSASAKIKYAF